MRNRNFVGHTESIVLFSQAKALSPSPPPKNDCTNAIVIDYSRTHIINENLLRESDKLLLMCDRSSSVYPLWVNAVVCCCRCCC